MLSLFSLKSVGGKEKETTFGCIMTVLNLIQKIVRRAFEKFDDFLETFGEKTHECMSSRKFFRSPINKFLKNCFFLFLVG